MVDKSKCENDFDRQYARLVINMSHCFWDNDLDRFISAKDLTDPDAKSVLLPNFEVYCRLMSISTHAWVRDYKRAFDNRKIHLDDAHRQMMFLNHSIRNLEFL